MDIVQLIALIVSIGIFAKMYDIMSKTEPLCFYISSDLSNYYRVYQPDNKTTFKDVIGCDDIKHEILNHIKDFKSGKNTGKGFIFTGASGNGKTLFARALAAESHLPFIEITPTNIQTQFIPNIIQFIIRKHSPSIIFIDECSSVLSQYSDGFLRKIDGLDQKQINGALIICATNKNISPEMYRSGRIDKVIMFNHPNTKEREMTLERAHIDTMWAEDTQGFTHADMNAFVREVKLGIDPETVLMKMKYGRTTANVLMTPEMKKRVIYHEIGHAFMGLVLKHSPKVKMVTVIHSGLTAGRNEFKIKDVDIYTQRQLLSEIYVLLASSECERMVFGDYSSLCAHDFSRYEDILKVLKDNFLWSGDKSVISKGIRRHVRKILSQHRDIVESMARMLSVKNRLNDEDLREHFSEYYNITDVNIHLLEKNS